MVKWWAARVELFAAIGNDDEKRLEELISSGEADCDERMSCGGTQKPAMVVCVERRCYNLGESTSILLHAFLLIIIFFFQASLRL